MTKKKKQSKKEDEVTPKSSVISLALNGSLDDVLKALVPPTPPKPEK